MARGAMRAGHLLAMLACIVGVLGGCGDPQSADVDAGDGGALFGSALAHDEVDGGADTPGPSIAIGTVDEAAQIPYVPLDASGDLALHTYGQGGLHAALTVQCVGLGKEAWVDFSLRSLGDYNHGEVHDGDAGIEAAPGTEGTSPSGRDDYPGEVSTTPTRRPSLLVCDDLLHPVECVHRPIIVMLGGLAPSLEALDDLHVKVRVDVHTEQGVSLSQTLDAYLRR